MDKEKRKVNENFGLIIKHFREKKGLSLQNMEDSTGVSASYINRLEKGSRACPTLPIVQKLASILDVNLNELLELSGIQKNDIKPKTLEELIIVNDFIILGKLATNEQKKLLVVLIDKVLNCSWKKDMFDNIAKICNIIDKLKTLDD